MTLEQLKEDLLSKKGVVFFQEKLFKSDSYIYHRRSFYDLFKYYRFKGVNEKLLMQALKELNMSARYCDDAGRYVWLFKNPENNSFLMHDSYKNTIETNKSKYTYEYLLNLWESV